MEPAKGCRICMRNPSGSGQDSRSGLNGGLAVQTTLPSPPASPRYPTFANRLEVTDGIVGCPKGTPDYAPSLRHNRSRPGRTQFEKRDFLRGRKMRRVTVIEPLDSIGEVTARVFRLNS